MLRDSAQGGVNLRETTCHQQDDGNGFDRASHQV